MQSNSLSINHNQSDLHSFSQNVNTYSQSNSSCDSAAQLDSESADSFTLDQSSYAQLISSLDRLSPFEAIRYAQEINKMNGFEVVGGVEVGRWKREMRNENQFKRSDENEKIKIMFRDTPSYENVEIKMELRESHVYGKSENEILEYEMQKSYMKMLSTT